MAMFDPVVAPDGLPCLKLGRITARLRTLVWSVGPRVGPQRFAQLLLQVVVRKVAVEI